MPKSKHTTIGLSWKTKARIVQQLKYGDSPEKYINTMMDELERLRIENDQLKQQLAQLTPRP